MPVRCCGCLRRDVGVAKRKLGEGLAGCRARRARRGKKAAGQAAAGLPPTPPAKVDVRDWIVKQGGQFNQVGDNIESIYFREIDIDDDDLAHFVRA